MTTAAPAMMRGRSGWMRTMTLIVGIALLSMTLLPPTAGAEPNQGNIHDNAMFQISLCEAGGGTAEVDVVRNGHGIQAIDVTCNDGVYGGMYCNNLGTTGTRCARAYPHPVPANAGSPIWPLDEVMPVLESGSLSQIEQVVAEVAAANDPESDAGSSVVSPDAPQPDQDTTPSQHKKGKHRKHGKGRKH